MSNVLSKIEIYNRNISNKNLKKQQCSYCKGYGIIKPIKPIVCSNCNGRKCFLCEMTGPYKCLLECENCFGSGLI